MAELKSLITKRAVIKGKLTRFQTFLRNDEFEEEILLERINNFETLYDDFLLIQSEIDSLTDSSQNSDTDVVAFEESYFGLLADAKKKMKKPLMVDPCIAPVKTKINVKLPFLDLPTFNGDQSEWTSFKETFIALIDQNVTLSSVEKFHYLKASLKGNTCRILNSIEITSDNYYIAWELLNERYENKKLIIFNHIKTLFNLPVIKNDNNLKNQLHNFVDITQSQLRMLNALGLPTDYWDALLLYLLSNKLDDNTRGEWEKCSAMSIFPTFTEFINFLNQRCHILEAMSPSTSGNPKVSRKQSYLATTKADTNNNCILCQGDHIILNCKLFLSFEPLLRKNKIQNLKACFRCLRVGHNSNSCQYKKTCFKCKGMHHTLLHFEQSKPLLNPQDSTESPMLSALSTSQKDNISLLSTVILKIKNKNGHLVHARAILDQGSQTNYITEQLASTLGSKQVDSCTSVIGISGIPLKIHKKTNVTIYSRHQSFKESIQCEIIKNIAPSIPGKDIPRTDEIPLHLKLADEHFNVSAPVDLLLGAHIFWKCLKNQRRQLEGLSLIETRFGWVVTTCKDSKETGMSLLSIEDTLMLNQSMERFWHQEECLEKKKLSQEDQTVETHFLETHYRDEDGRFVVEMPLKSSPNVLGNSYNHALKRWNSTSKRLSKSNDLHLQYTAFMDEYIALKHMSEISESTEENNNIYYLPHQCVIKPSSTTTKLRVVFDGSAKTTSGLSLNDISLPGPRVQDDLFDIIVRFRTHNYVISADIEKMYRQIWINPKQRDLLRIVWNEDNNLTPKHYRLNTVTYGTTAAPFLATRCLRQLGSQAADQFPEAGVCIQQDFYVADLLTGANDLAQLRKTRYEISNILASAGMTLHKWRANDPHLLMDQADSELINTDDSQDISLNENSSDITKILGLFWRSSHDTLRYNVLSNIQTLTSTKRQMLSVISQIYDPLGLLAPIIIRAKLLLQILWKEGSGWDEPISPDLQKTWNNFQLQLEAINKLIIPRHVPTVQPMSELHGFCDASERAYGACIYIRTKVDNGYTCNLLCARSRVAPLHSVSLPRLELCGALLLARLVHKVTTALSFKGHIYYWCDSTITLAWIESTSSNWKTYVANRVSEIHSLTKKGQWRHCGVLRSCITCFKVQPRHLYPQMGNLPKSRVMPGRPFSISGVDYAGPYFIKSGSLRSKAVCKAYLVVFVCFATKAVHLEIANDLTTDAFLNVFKRFIARRGIFNEIHSDNATNFIGSSNYIESMCSFLKKSSPIFQNYLSNFNIVWKFIPARSPHFGGLWEAAVKSAKRHLTKVLGSTVCTYEELSTLGTQIESILNSRPLTPLSSDPSDLLPLTPGHFLIGDSLLALPQPSVQEHQSRLSRYQLLRQMMVQFWRRWSTEYLSSLQTRAKWHTGSVNELCVGSLVIMKDENTHPCHWPMGRVIQLHPGADGTVRVATIRTPTNTTRRAVSQLCLLPTD